MLAEYTDQLLAGKDTTIPDQLEQEIRTVRRVYHLVAPDEAPDPAFRESLSRILDKEWQKSRKRHSRFISLQGIERYIAAAATIIIIAFFLFLIESNLESNPLSGTAGGSSGDPIQVIIIMAVFFLIGLLAFSIWTRKQ